MMQERYLSGGFYDTEKSERSFLITGSARLDYYSRERTPIPRYYQVHPGGKTFERDGIRVLPVQTFCRELRLP